MTTSNKIEEEVKYPSIDDLTDERKTYLDSEIFEYKRDNYRYSKCSEFCEQFIRSYKRHKSNKYYYMEALNSMMTRQAITLVVDYSDIYDTPTFTEEEISKDKKRVVRHSDFFHTLIDQNPKLFIKAFRKAAFDVLLRMHYDYAMDIRHNFKVTLSNATMFKKEITDINNDDVGHVIYTEDFVVSIAAQKNYTKSMAWSCGECGKLTYKESIGFRLSKLTQCMYCNSKDINESGKDAITDTMQEIKLQQKYERIISGRVPKTIIGVIFGKDMINPIQAGDIASVTGIIQLQPSPVSAENAISEYYIEIQWIEKKADDFLIEDDPELEEKVKKFIDPKDEDTGYKNLIESIAPSVMGHELIKEALLLQTVGSDSGFLQDNSRHRGEIQILLVGDSGTAKTKLAYYVSQLYARAVYVSSNVTEAGITASVNIATKSGTPVLEAGAYLLASSESGGLCICDEIEKTDSKVKDRIAPCLDDRQIVEIHKHTIHQSIQINCASLHIANPKTGESWDIEKTIKENTDFENWYLSRFCTWIVRDEVNKEFDSQKAKHYLGQFGNIRRQYKIKDGNINDSKFKYRLEYGDNKDIKSVPEMAMFNKHVRKNCHPEFDPNSRVAKKLENFYLSIRPLNEQAKGSRITIRALGDLVRFAEASARAHMRNEVTEKDADIAIKIVQASIASSGFNMFTGKYELHQMEEEARAKKKGMAVGDGFYTAEELLQNKTAREIVANDIDRLAQKRQNRFYREIATKMKKVIKVVKMYALQKCRDCGGDGFRREGGMTNACYSCSGHGGFKQNFNLNEVNFQLSDAGLTPTDVTELTSALIKKNVISPKFNSQNTYYVTKDYKNALLEFTAIEANIEIVMAAEMEKSQGFLIKNPEMQEKINKLRNMMPKKTRDDIRKRLEEVDDDDEEDEE